MRNLRSIVCAVDFSEASRHALRWAEVFAQRSRSRLTVVNAVDPLLAEAARRRFNQDLVHAETEPALRKFIAVTGTGETAPSADAGVDVREGDPSDVILEAARKQGADLIVLGTRGLGGIRKWLLGSTTERVLRRTHTAVLAVPYPEGDSVVAHADPAQLEWGPILAATDFSETSTRAVQWAADLAQEVSRPLLLLNVVEPIAVAPEWHVYIEEAEEPRVATAREKLQASAQRFSATVATELIVSRGRAADVIASTAEERGASVIAMGLHGDGGPLGVRPGSIAYRVLSLATTPVLVVPPESHANVST
jgi:nucleotide-binding universal stress UspA family protein